MFYSLSAGIDFTMSDLVIALKGLHLTHISSQAYFIDICLICLNIYEQIR